MGIKELVEIVGPIECEGKMHQLLTGIRSGSIKTRKDARQLFRGYADPKRSCNQLIQKTRQELIARLMMTARGETEIQKAYYECHTQYSTALILISQGAKTAGIDLARGVFLKAMRFEFIHLALSLATILTKHYSSVVPDPRLHARFSKALASLTDLVEKDARVTRLYCDAMIALRSKSSYTKGLRDKLEQYSLELSNISNPTVEVRYHASLLQIINCFARQDYSRAALKCTLILKKFEDKVQVRASQRASLISLQAVAAIADGQYRLAEQSLLQAIELAGSNYANWQILNNYRSICALHEGNYLKAGQIFLDAREREQPDFMRERWAIVEAYLFIFDAATAGDGRFRLGKFFNETMEASQDKAGLNVNILIADLLISLRQNRDRFLHRLEAVRTYRYRYLKGKPNERVRLFLDMLFQLPRCDFDLRRVQRATEHLLRKLEKRTVYANHNLEIELIRFESLWQNVLAQLGEQRMVQENR